MRSFARRGIGRGSSGGGATLYSGWWPMVSAATEAYLQRKGSEVTEALRFALQVVECAALFARSPARRRVADGVSIFQVLARLQRSALFSRSYYVATNPDVALSPIDPLVHYVLFGAFEGRAPHPLFSANWFIRHVPEATGRNPLFEYLKRGATAAYPHPLFKGTSAATGIPARDRITPLERYLENASAFGDPHPLFSNAYYLYSNPDVAAVGVNPLLHWLAYGVREHRDPHPYFSLAYYTRYNPDVGASNPLEHYITSSTRSRPVSPLISPRFELSDDSGASETGQTPLEAALRNRVVRSKTPRRSQLDGQLLLARQRILIASGYPDTPSDVYRVRRLSESLSRLGALPSICRIGDLDGRATLPDTDVVVLFRVPMSVALARAIGEYRRRGAPIVFDIDDYLFEPAIANTAIVDGMRMLPPHEQELYGDYVARMRATACMADFSTVSTEYLAERIRELGKPSYVIPNCLSVESLGPSLRQPRLHGALVIGYASGTLTHQRDFKTIVRPLARLLALRSHVRLSVVGLLELAEFAELAPWAARIDRREAVPFNQRLDEIAQFDINLAPLEAGNPFCEAKSAIKFIDAAAVGIPTVAAATGSFGDAIRDGETGFLARTETDWLDAMFRLVDDHLLRRRVGQAALASVRERFGPAAHAERVNVAYCEMLHEHARVCSRTVRRSRPLEFCLQVIPAALSPPLKEFNPRSMDLHWVVPPTAKASGGHFNIFSAIGILEGLGHRNTVWVHPLFGDGDVEPEGVGAFVSATFPKLKIRCRPLLSYGPDISGDAVIATDYRSCYAARGLSAFRRRFYFVQDFEAAFCASGADSLLAERTYRMGFDALSNGEWLSNRLTREFGMWSTAWEQAPDPSIYFAATDRRDGRRVAFYARHSTPRRAVELGLLALDVLHESGSSFEVDFFGCQSLPYTPRYQHRVLGIVSGAELGRLYRQSTVGICFSATNVSLIPREMFACGLPVIELDTECNRSMLPAECASLVPADPERIAAVIEGLLNEPATREMMSAAAVAHVRRFSWPRNGEILESAIQRRIMTAAVQP